MNRRACPACAERYPVSVERTARGAARLVHHLPNGELAPCEHDPDDDPMTARHRNAVAATNPWIEGGP